MSEKKRFLLRVSPEVYDAVRRWADDEMRSVNGQIEWILREALRRRGREPTKPGGSRGGSSRERS